MKKTIFSLADDDKILEAMIDQVEKSTAQASAAIDDALAFVEASNQRLDAMSRTHSLRHCDSRTEVSGGNAENDNHPL